MDALAATSTQAALQSAVRRLAERYPTPLLLAAVTRRLSATNSQVRGGLGELCTLLPQEETAAALRAVAGNRQKTPQERTTAALILQRFLEQPVPPGLLADLAGAEEAPYQSLLEAVAESKRNRHVLLEYVVQMQEHPVDVAYMVLRLIDRLPPADGAELLRLIAHDVRRQVAHAAIDRLAAAAAAPGGEQALRSLHVLALTLPPDDAALAERSLRKLQFSGKRYTPPTATGWQALIGPSDPSGFASVWFVRRPGRAAEVDSEVGSAAVPDAVGDQDGVWLGFIVSLQSGILQFSGSEDMERSFLPPPAPAGELVTVRTNSGQTAVLLAAPFDVGRWLVHKALAAHWAQPAPPPLPDEYILYNDLLWQFGAPHLAPELADIVARSARPDDRAGGAAAAGAAALSAAADALVADPAMEGWLRWSQVTWQNVKYRSQQTPEVPAGTLVSLLLRELGRMTDHRLLLDAMAAGLRVQALWYAVANAPVQAEYAVRLAQVMATLPITENPLLARLLERGLTR